MNGLTIYNRALRLSHTSGTDYPTTQGDEDIDLVYKELIDHIVVSTKGDYFWDIGQSTTVINQSEYVAEKLGIAPDDLDIKKINKVFIKYSDSDTYYTKAIYQNPAVLEEHPDYYKTNQSKSEPFFYIQDNSIFIYPAPDVAVTNGLELFVIKQPAAITTASVEDDIEIPVQFHRLITLGMMITIYHGQGKINEANAIEGKYDAGIRDMVSFLKSRYNNPLKKNYTGLNKFR